MDPLLRRGERAEAGIHPVRYAQELVVLEQRGYFVLVGLELVERCPNSGVFVCRVLELDYGYRYAIEEHDDIWPSVALPFDYGELITTNQSLLLIRSRQAEGGTRRPLPPLACSTGTPSIRALWNAVALTSEGESLC